MKRPYFPYLLTVFFLFFFAPIFVLSLSSLIAPGRTSDFNSGMQPAKFCQNGNDIVIDGDLSSGLHKEWSALVASGIDGKELRLFLNSRGGNNDVAESISIDVKKLGITTVLPANSICLSACPLIFVGSEKRIADPSATLGFHRPSSRVLGFTFGAFNEARVEEAMKHFRKNATWLTENGAFNSDEMKTRTAEIMQSEDSDFAVIQQTGPIPVCDR